MHPLVIFQPFLFFLPRLLPVERRQLLERGGAISKGVLDGSLGGPFAPPLRLHLRASDWRGRLLTPLGPRSSHQNDGEFGICSHLVLARSRTSSKSLRAYRELLAV